MKTILLCIDTDVERANEQVSAITALPMDTEQVRVVIYHVFRTDDEGANAEDLKSVQAATESLEAAGFPVEVSQSSGDAVQHIIEKAEEVDAAMLCLAGRKRSPAGKALFGSVTQDVSLKSDRPVILSTAE
ncbi:MULTISPECIES: universal stress protein [Halobellus]|jgi:nucleotide-binding universal stress UspA family protein|uniref:universal stress protein n=1 Tax=Halobellus TaxID=1073986 RepID=UPI000EF1C6AF|nr:MULTISPECIES: universal stress protein [Halobellus]MDQ2053943.1 universal stress protein [Halobellus sp. H-GB7]RLM88377.1 universal stress protein [Halobellus sp. Atlit-38R]